MLTGKPFTKPRDKLSEGKPTKLAINSKLSLQWEETKPVKEWSKLSARGGGLLGQGKRRKSPFWKIFFAHW